MRELPEDFEVTETRIIKRITLRSTLISILEIVNIQRGIGLTLQLLFRSPAVVAKAYLGKDRYRIMAPFQFLVVCSSLLSLLYLLIQHETSMLQSIMSGMMQKDEYDPETQKLITKRALLVAPVLLGVYLFLQALLARAFHRRSPYNLAELLVFASYWLGQTMLFFGFLLLLSVIPWPNYLAIPITLMSLMVLGIGIYYVLGLRQLFGRKWWQTILYAIFIQFFSAVGWSLALGLTLWLVGRSVA